jgi:drug/metabolite transporter (DMT)-like permease
VPASIVAIVLLAALLHAAWNLLVRAGADRALDALLVAVAASVVSAVAAAFLPAPARASWPFLAASAALHSVYFALLAQAYREGDFGPSYTLMRGLAPVLVAVAGVAGAAAEPLASSTVLGALLVGAGVVAMALLARAPGALPRRALGFVLANAAVIAAYTLVDGAGVRRAGHAVAYTAWVFVLDAFPLAALALATRGRAVLEHARRHWLRGVAGGGFTLAAYALALWAMTRAPIAGVAALRETSVVFATALATWRLREPFGAGRLAAAALVALGVALLRR